MSDNKSYESIKRAAIKGVAWTGFESFLRQIVQVGANLLLANLLAPDDFGVLGMALILQGVAQLVADFGIGAALVQRQTLEPKALSSAFWANLGVSFGLTLVLFSAAPYAGAFYDNSEVVQVIQVLSLSLLLGGLRTLPRALLYKDLMFSTLSRIGIASSLFGSSTAVFMASAGCGVWSLVAQPIVGNVVETSLLWIMHKWRPAWVFDWRSMRELAQFSYGVLGTNLVNYATRNMDNMLIGKYLGSTPLGYYALAYQIMLYPLSQISSVIVKVLFPTLSKLQGRPDDIRAAFLAGISMIALVTFPMMCGLLAVAQDFIVVLFGPKWLPMELVLQIFCAIGLLQSIGTTVGTIYMVTGQTQLMLRVTLYATPIIIGSFVVGLLWGIEGVAICYGIVSFVLFFVLLRIALSLIELRIGDVFSPLRGTIASSLLMLACMLGFGQLFSIDVPVIRLCATVMVGCVSYGLVSFVLNRPQLIKLADLFQYSRRPSEI